MIFVVGNIRSGTSRIAESLHQDFNVHMGRAFGAQSVGPNQRSDWEEITLAIEAANNELTEEWFVEYCAMRNKWLEAARSVMDIPVPTWGAKCCLLMKYPDLIPSSAFVIYATRSAEEAKASARKWMRFHKAPVAASVLELQEKLAGFSDEVKARADLVIDYSLPMDKVRRRISAALEVM